MPVSGLTGLLPAATGSALAWDPDPKTEHTCGSVGAGPAACPCSPGCRHRPPVLYDRFHCGTDQGDREQIRIQHDMDQTTVWMAVSPGPAVRKIAGHPRQQPAPRPASDAVVSGSPGMDLSVKLDPAFQNRALQVPVCIWRQCRKSATRKYTSGFMKVHQQKMPTAQRPSPVSGSMYWDLVQQDQVRDRAGHRAFPLQVKDHDRSPIIHYSVRIP